MLRHRFAVAAASLALLCAYAPGGGVEVRFDGHGPPERTEVAYSFSCDDATARVSYRQTRLPPKSVPKLEQALRVELLELRGASGSVAAEELQPLRDLLSTFAWIERVEAVCREGAVELRLSAMPLRPWIRYIEEELDERPALVLETVGVSREGRVLVERAPR